jgi:CTP:molybdopterin cytidylyltransferase MocA
MNTDNLCVLVLAAGSGTRFGMPKALASYNHSSFLDIIIDKLSKLNLNYCVVVSEEVEASINTSNLESYVINHVNSDMYSSVLLGLHHTLEFSKWLIWPVDFPTVELETISKLVNTPSDRDILIPRTHGSNGHPIILSNNIINKIDEVNTLRELCSFTICDFVEVNDIGILKNINYKEDLSNEFL